MGKFNVDAKDAGKGETRKMGMNYMLAHHIVVRHKLNEHCAQRFVSNTHFSKLFRFCTY